MRLRSQSNLFTRAFIDAVITRPLLRTLLEQRQNPRLVARPAPEVDERDQAPVPLTEAA